MVEQAKKAVVVALAGAYVGTLLLELAVVGAIYAVVLLCDAGGEPAAAGETVE